MIERRRMIVLGLALALLAGCGSGSTGLSRDFEQEALDLVRSTGTCTEDDDRRGPLPAGTTYCATDSPDAIAPGGQRAATAATPNPAPTGSPVPSVAVIVEGFGPGAACAAAARTGGLDWRTGPLVAVDARHATIFPLPSDVAAPSENTLVCFDSPPAALPAEIHTLAEVNPTVVFVLPDS